MSIHQMNFSQELPAADRNVRVGRRPNNPDNAQRRPALRTDWSVNLIRDQVDPIAFGSCSDVCAGDQRVAVRERGERSPGRCWHALRLRE